VCITELARVGLRTAGYRLREEIPVVRSLKSEVRQASVRVLMVKLLRAYGECLGARRR
jgi:hypothetical protein